MDRQRLAQFTHLLVQDPAETLGTVGLRADVLETRVDRVPCSNTNGAHRTASTNCPLDGRPQLLVVGGAWRAIGRPGTSSPPCRDRDGASSSRPTKCKGAMLNPGPKNPDSHGCPIASRKTGWVRMVSFSTKSAS